MKKSNVEVTYDSKDFVIFKTTCQCGSNNHTLTVCVEDLNVKSKGEAYPFITFDFECGRFEIDRSYENLLERIWRRIEDACKILFFGELRVDESFIFRDDNHLKDFRNALEEAIKQVEEYKKSKEAKV